jgi:hypothetical protein
MDFEAEGLLDGLDGEERPAREQLLARLADEGFELFTILPPGPAGGADRIYLRREKPRGQAPGFLRESKA